MSSQLAEQEAISTAENPYGIPATEEVKPEAPKPRADLATVGSVQFAVTNSGYAVFMVTLESSSGFDINHMVFLPNGWAENFSISGSGLEGEDRKKFGQSIHNSKNTATFDRYLAIAAENGRTDYTRLRAAQSVTELAAAYTELLSGLAVVVLRRPNNQGYLNVSSVRSTSQLEDAKFLQLLEKGGYVCSLE